jgi:hypothetical protein
LYHSESRVLIVIWMFFRAGKSERVQPYWIQGGDGKSVIGKSGSPKVLRR